MVAKIQYLQWEQQLYQLLLIITLLMFISLLLGGQKVQAFSMVHQGKSNKHEVGKCLFGSVNLIDEAIFAIA